MLGLDCIQVITSKDAMKATRDVILTLSYMAFLEPLLNRGGDMEPVF